MIYTNRIQNNSEIQVGKTYHKDERHAMPLHPLLKIEILSKSEGVVIARIGSDGLEQTLTEDEAMLYINAQGGYGH